MLVFSVDGLTRLSEITSALNKGCADVWSAMVFTVDGLTQFSEIPSALNKGCADVCLGKSTVTLQWGNKFLACYCLILTILVSDVLMFVCGVFFLFNNFVFDMPLSSAIVLTTRGSRMSHDRS